MLSTIDICNKYGCDLICENEATVTIKSRCGHICIVSPNKLRKHKEGVICLACIYSMESATCITCNNQFQHTEKSFLFCSRKCSNKRNLSEATKKKISESVLKTHSDNVDENGNIKSSEEREKNKKRKSENFDEDGNRIKKSRMLSYNKIKHEYEIRGCRLLTTEDEYYSLRTTMDIRNIHFKIVSSCGHEMGSLYYGLIVDETGVVYIADTETNRVMRYRLSTELDYSTEQIIVLSSMLFS